MNYVLNSPNFPSSHHLGDQNKKEKLESKGEAIFDTPFIIQNHAENMKKILGALWNLPAN